jgi:hypothetical protein
MTANRTAFRYVEWRQLAGRSQFDRPAAIYSLQPLANDRTPEGKPINAVEQKKEKLAA